MVVVILLLNLMMCCMLRFTRATDAGDAAGLPRFLLEPISTVAEIGNPVLLTCSVQPAAAVVRWTVNGSLVASVHRRRWSEGRDGNLRIAAFNSSQHEGVYQCHATTAAGTIVSREARLDAAAIGSFQLARRGPESVTIVEGNVAVIPCPSVPPSKPPPVVEYQLNGVKLMTSARVVIQPSGNLHIGDVRPSDQGVYQCVASNPLTGSRVPSPLTHRLVVTRPPPADVAPVFTTHDKATEQVTARLGSELTLECAADGWPVPQLSWEKYGGHLPAGRHSMVLGSLVIHAVEKFDAGTYLCKANNSAGQPPARVVSVEILEPPAVEAVTSVVNSTEGTTVVLRCRVHGSAKMSTRWLHNGSPVTHSPQSITIKETSLTLTNVQLGHQGVYQCLAKNDIGSAHSAMLLTVIATAPAPGMPEGDYDIDEEDIAVIDVSLPSHERGRSEVLGGDRIRHSGGRHVDDVVRTGDTGFVAAPSRPEVSKVSDTSVLVQWMVPSSSGPHITSFRLQYKELLEERSAVWQTVDEDIPPAWRSYEVARLRIGRSYRFRVVAVFSNGESRPSPLSLKFQIIVSTTTPSLPKLIRSPIIVEVRPLSVTELFIGWQMEGNHRSIEGFFIYYAPFDKDDSVYEKHAVHGSSVRHAVLSHLRPGTPYTIRMTSYATASPDFDGGESDFSNSVVRSTHVSSDDRSSVIGQMSDDADAKLLLQGRPSARQPTARWNFQPRVSTPETLTAHLPEIPRNGAAGATTMLWDEDVEEYVGSTVVVENQLLYVVLGTVLGVVVLITIVCIAMCMWRQQQPQRVIAAAKHQKQLQQNTFVAMSMAPASILQSSSLLRHKPGPVPPSSTRFDRAHLPGCGGVCSNNGGGGAGLNGSDVGLLRDVSNASGIYANGQAATLGRRKVVPSPQPVLPSPSCNASMSHGSQLYNDVYNNSFHSSVAEKLSNLPPNGSTYSPIYSKLTDNEDSPSPCFDRRPGGGGLPSIQSYTIQQPPQQQQQQQHQSLDHIPRSHERHRQPYWAVEPIRQVHTRGQHGGGMTNASGSSVQLPRRMPLSEVTAGATSASQGDLCGFEQGENGIGGEMKDQATNTDLISECGTLTLAFGLHCDAFSSTLERQDCDSDVATASPGTSIVRDSFVSMDSPPTTPRLFFDCDAQPYRTGDLHPPLPITYWGDLYGARWGNSSRGSSTERSMERHNV